MTYDLTTAAHLLQTQYSNFADLFYKKHPTLWKVVNAERMNGHDGEFVGKNFSYSVEFGGNQGVSGTVAKAQLASGSSIGREFLATLTEKHGVLLIKGLAIAASKGEGAYVDAITKATDDTMYSETRRLAFDLLRGSGIRGQRSAIAGNVVTLTAANDARNFDIDMLIGASPNADGSAPRVGSSKVTAVDLANNKFTLANAAAIAGFVNNDFLFVDGEPLTCMRGMNVTTPLVAPAGGDNFRGVDRSVFPEFLAGDRLTTAVSLANIAEDNIDLICSQIADRGGDITDAVMSFKQFGQIKQRTQAQVEYVMTGGEAKIGFATVVIVTNAGPVRCWGDPDVPVDLIRGFNSSAHYIRKIGELVHINRDDGQTLVRSSTDDAVEGRTRFLGDYIQSNTRDHFVFQVRA
ncbi:MAG: hypothetical protein ACM3YM_06190 [Sphingomonadales bacterium]|jgi:hypothetical protein